MNDETQDGNVVGITAKPEAVLIQGDPLNRNCNGKLYETRPVPDSVRMYHDIKSNELKDPHYNVIERWIVIIGTLLNNRT